MTLTVVVGSSGSGKTTFLNDTTKSHKCTYIRQYHNLRPYITVSKIPHFDPTRLPYWDTYVAEGKADSIKVGGTMAGEFTAGLSGGQRKILLFELICQRTANQSDLLLVFDEPFAGVTDDFVPFIAMRLNELRRQHNILLVTNDHVETLKKMADNTIVVSAIDRTTVQINGLGNVVNREKAILALSVGNDFVYNKTSYDDLKFFFNVEVTNNGTLMGVVAFTIFAFGLFLAALWDSSSDASALIIVAGGIIAFFCINPYLQSLVDWRTFLREEAEALLHSSESLNNALKTTLTLFLLFIVSLVQWGITNAVVDGFEHNKFWLSMLLDSASFTFPFIFFGLYTTLPFQAVDIFASMPFLFSVFFSTTFSPGAGVAAVKELRYLFPRFYFWCMIPQVQDSMEGCPKSELNMLYMTLSAVLTLVLFLIFAVLREIKRASRSKQVATKQNKLRDAEFKDLQIELYGEDYMNRHHDMVTNSEHSSRQNSSHHLGGHQGSAHGSAATATAAVPDAPNKRPTAFAKKDDEVQA